MDGTVTALHGDIEAFRKAVRRHQSRTFLQEGVTRFIIHLGSMP